MGSTARGPWRPLLSGELAATALRRAVRIADALREPVRRWCERPWDPDADVDVVGVEPWTCLLFDPRHGSPLEAAAPDLVDKVLETVLEAVDRPARPDLYGGLSGLAWLLVRCRVPHAEDRLARVDATLRDLLGAATWDGGYDLIDGLVGFGVYFLERLETGGGGALEALEVVLRRLEESAENAGGGITWLTPARRLSPGARRDAPRGYYNLGVAHGVAGVVAFLGKLHELALERGRVERLLGGAVRWLLAQEAGEGTSRFAAFLPREAPPLRGPCRLAWCYGDLGVSAALLNAARRVGEPDWESAALRIARYAAARPPARSGVADAGLCHGGAGNGHVFNRLYQATGLPELAEAARFWLDYTLRFERELPAVAGYASRHPAPPGHDPWRADASFLTGAAGIGLALLAACADVEPTWDRLLLVDVPLRGSSA